MNNPNLRIKFTKTGSLQFISHLDLLRTMKSSMIRAKIPLAYSEGFNPHPKIAFALPLSIGAQSVCEYMDIKLAGEIDAEEVRARLDAETTDEMKILEAYESVNKLAEIGWAGYRLDFDGDISAAAKLFDSPLVVMKRTKSGEKEVDILPLIKRRKISGDRFEAVLAASGESYLNPEYPAAEIAKATGIYDYTVMRECVYLSDGETLFR